MDNEGHLKYELQLYCLSIIKFYIIDIVINKIKTQ